MSSQESYNYDDLHRLTLSAIGMVAGIPSISYSYDAVGNFAAKSDYASSYGYAANSNRVTSVQLAAGGSKSFGYDSNGNLTTENGVETIEYNAFNKPTVIRRPNVAGLPQATEIAYGADLMRYRKVTQDGTTTLYVDKLFERISRSDKVQERYYIEDIAALTVTTENGSTTPSIAFTHKDRLGSTVALVDDDGGDPLEFHSYDPFGKPRKGSGAPKSPIELASGYMTRGFTDHEHMDEVQLIHMNGRGYDYNLGRFLSVDPFIVEPGNSQALNPYVYVLNNPLAGVDPTGYCTASTGTRIKTCADVKVTAINSDTGKSTSTTVSVNTKNGADVQAKVGTAIGSTTNTAGVESIGSAVHIGSNGARTNLMSGGTDTSHTGGGGVSGGGGSGLEPIQGSPGRGLLKSYANAATFGIAFGDISSENWLNADPQDQADMEAYGDQSSLFDKFALGAISPGRKIETLGKAVFGLRGASAYSTLFETTLKSTSYPGVSRAKHFQEANMNLLRQMDSDPCFANMMRGLGVGLSWSPRGMALRRPPSGFTWHHEQSYGVMRLVPRSQHTPGSPYWDMLHPQGKGGYSIWGK